MVQDSQDTHQQPQQHQQQQPNLGSNLNNLNMMSANNNNNLMNIAGIGAGSNSNNNSNAINNLMNSNSSNSNQTATPQIQHQLIESFRLAVQAGLISADLLNTKLPQDVLSLLYQLFQTLNQYMTSTQKLNNLAKRRATLSAQQYKIETETLNAEILAYKENLIGLQAKINTAHMQLKQMQANNGSNSSTSSPNNNDTAISSLASAAAAAGVPLSDLPLIKDPQRSKFLDLLKDNNSNQTKLSNSLGGNSSNQFISRQSSLQPQTLHTQQKLQQQSQNSLFSNYQSSQWSNFKMSENTSPFSVNQNGPGSSGNEVIDDRITPFIPGQLWAGQTNNEDDPNCTPGSVSKPLLTETIDPESILSSLQRGNQWSNGFGGISDLSNSMFANGFSINNGLQLNSTSGIVNNRSTIGGSNSNSNQQRGNTGGAANNNNSSWNNAANGGANGNNFSSQLPLQNQNLMNSNNGNSINNQNMSSSNANNNGSLSEQLWGFRSSSRMGNSTLPSLVQGSNNNNNPGNRNSASFGGSNSLNNNNSNNSCNTNGNSLLNQQQFFRSNSWNVNAQQQQQGANNNTSNNNNNNNAFNPLNGNVNGGNFILIRGVTQQIDQSTLRALCAQHASGPLTYYKYITQMTCVIVRYNSKEESNNALSKLNGILLGNTTIFTQSLSENELKFLFTL
jgi:hypothetical protein